MLGKKHKDQKRQTPPVMRYSIVLFVVAMAYAGWQNEKRAREGDPDAVSIKRFEVIQRFTDLDRWRMIANPAYNRTVEFEELKVGQGDGAACGQHVALEVNALPQEGQVLDPELMPADPVRFTIGDGEVIEAWDRGVRGMCLGGVRRVIAGARAVNPDQTDYDALPVVFDLALTDLDPLAPLDGPAFRYETLRKGADGGSIGYGVSCSEPLAVTLRMLDKQGKTIYERTADNPLKLLLGHNDFGHGMDRGLVGMHPGEVRRITIPRAYYPAGESALPFPDAELVVVEAMRVPYNDTLELPEIPNLPEEPNEPDSQPPARDQTIPDDGGDRQGGGA